MGSWLKILSKYLAATYFQVVHFMSAQSFDKGQGRTSGSCEFSRRQRLAGVYGESANGSANINPFV
jgi:hypothetical protein